MTLLNFVKSLLIKLPPVCIPFVRRFRGGTEGWGIPRHDRIYVLW